MRTLGSLAMVLLSWFCLGIPMAVDSPRAYTEHTLAGTIATK